MTSLCRATSKIGLDDLWIIFNLAGSTLGDFDTKLNDVYVVTHIKNKSHVMINKEDRQTRIDDFAKSTAEFSCRKS